MLVQNFGTSELLPKVAYGRSLGLKLRKKFVNEDISSDDFLLPLKTYLKKGWFERPRGPKFSICIHEEPNAPQSIRRKVRKSIRNGLSTPVITDGVMSVLKKKIRKSVSDGSIDGRHLQGLLKGDRLLRILLCDYPAFSLKDVYGLGNGLYKKLDTLFVLDAYIKKDGESWVADIRVRRILDGEISLQYTTVTVQVWNIGMALDWLMNMLVFS